MLAQLEAAGAHDQHMGIVCFQRCQENLDQHVEHSYLAPIGTHPRHDQIRMRLGW